MIQDNSFVSLNKLEDLNLSSNKIESISNATFVGLENSLRTLSLGSNSLKSVDIAAFSYLNNLEHVDLSNNSGIVSSSYAIIQCSTTTTSTTDNTNN